MNPQYPGYIPPNQPQGYGQQQPQVYGQPQQPFMQQQQPPQGYIQQQQQCYMQPQPGFQQTTMQIPQPGYIGSPQPNFVQPEQNYIGSPQQNYMQPQPNYIGSPQQNFMQPQPNYIGSPQPNYIGSPQQNFMQPQPNYIGSPQQNYMQTQPNYIGSPQQSYTQPSCPQSPQQELMQEFLQPQQNNSQSPQDIMQEFMDQPQQSSSQSSQQEYTQQQQPNYTQQQNYSQQQQQDYSQSPQQSSSDSQQQEIMKEFEEDSQPQQQVNQAKTRQTTVKLNSIAPSNEPVAYVSQSWNTSPIQQITGKPVSVRPHFYYVFTPDMFTETNNPWTAAMWLHSFNNLPESMSTSADESEEQSSETSEITKPEEEPSKPQKPAEKPSEKPATAKPAEKPAQKPHRPQKTTQKPATTKPAAAAAKKTPEASKVHVVNPSKNNNRPMKTESEIFKFESIAQFQKLRHHATVESALKQLNEIATDLSFISPDSFQPDSASCFICCNSYVTPKYQLGVGPINDAITFAANHKYMGYTVYFVHNQHHTLFLRFLKEFLSKTTKYLTVFYAGHGAQIVDTSGDEDDGYDEVMVFDSGYVVDDELAIYIQKYSLGRAHTILIADCCHSGTIWDIPEKLKKAEKFPANIMSISSSLDNQTAKQTEIESNFQGVFTFNFWTLIRNRPSINIVEAQKILNRTMIQFSQQIVMYPTRKDMLKKPIFPLMVKH